MHLATHLKPEHPGGRLLPAVAVVPRELHGDVPVGEGEVQAELGQQLAVAQLIADSLRPSSVLLSPPGPCTAHAGGD